VGREQKSLLSHQGLLFPQTFSLSVAKRGKRNFAIEVIFST
jgi:hypothetical protein